MKTEKMKVLLYLKKERSGQVGQGSDYGTDNHWAFHRTVQLQALLQS